MPSPRLYLDEDVPLAVARGLRRRGFEVETTADRDERGASDESQLRVATASGMCLFTFNRGDFARLHGETLARGEHHAGIVVSRQAPVGVIVRALAAFLAERTPADLVDQLIWLAQPE